MKVKYYILITLYLISSYFAILDLDRHMSFLTGCWVLFTSAMSIYGFIYLFTHNDFLNKKI